MLTKEQADEIAETLTYALGARDVLELHELRLSKFGDVKVDPSDPCSIDVCDAVDALSLVREYLTDAVDLLSIIADQNQEGK